MLIYRKLFVVGGNTHNWCWWSPRDTPYMRGGRYTIDIVAIAIACITCILMSVQGEGGLLSEYLLGVEPTVRRVLFIMCTGRREPGYEEGGMRQDCQDPWRLFAVKVLQVDISRVADGRDNRYTWGKDNWRSNLTHEGHGIWFEQVAIIYSQCPLKTLWRKIQETVYKEHLWQGWYLWPFDSQREYLLDSVSIDLIVQREHLLVSGWQIAMQRHPRTLPDISVTKVFFPDVAISISRYIDPSMPWDWHENTNTYQTCHFCLVSKVMLLKSEWKSSKASQTFV